MSAVLVFFAAPSPARAYEIYDMSGDSNFGNNHALQFGASLTDYLLYNTGTARFDISDDLLIGAESADDASLWFQNAPLERLMWDGSEDYFFLSDALVVDGNVNVQGTTLRLDSDNSGAGADTDIISEQGSDSDGTLRYSASNNRWEVSNDAGSFQAVATDYVAETDDGNSGTSDTIDWSAGKHHKSTLTGNVTYTFTAPSGATDLIFKLVQDATGGRTVTWPTAVKWSGGTAPTLTSAANAVDLVRLYFDGTNYYGSIETDLQ